ncbi:MAG: MORN repeat protein [uncultured Sulfurovum sp.]|uniref:MORN repeat protein n=1 Tax=uncultured Sulfurovum sp. TaxID=269237 RepID=A0A6S6SER1_9BACT|nr:MAG: MORN repeat protein [uncultured Sulfurovum sp.]
MRFIITLLLITNFLSAGDKIALLIGNNDYSFQPLDNPLNDVDGIYKTLSEIGFKSSNITVLKNKSQNEMKKALFEFEQKASKAEIALIYFSGHGMQVNNTNYMFPANTTATKPIHLEGLVNLNFFIQSASSAKYGIVLVDACRNNPLVKYFQNGKHKGSTAKKGLGQVTPIAGQVVIGFATSAGDTADDGSGNMSPYARALSVRLKEKDDIRNILGKVGNDVSGKYEQNPIYRANLASSVYLSQNKIKILKPKIEIVKKINSTSQLIVASQMKGRSIIGGKVWQDEKTIKRFNWEEAIKYCNNLTLHDDSNWRLPTPKELKELYENKEKLKFFDDYFYWTSTSSNKKSNSAWVVAFDAGFSGTHRKNYKLNTRCIKK